MKPKAKMQMSYKIKSEASKRLFARALGTLNNFKQDHKATTVNT